MTHILIKNLREEIIFVALKRVSKYIVDHLWSATWGSDELGIEYELAVKKSKLFEKDIVKFSEIDLDLNWGRVKIKAADGWNIIKIGNFNPWYAGEITLNELLTSIESIYEFVGLSDEDIAYAEFKHYYEFLKTFFSKSEVDFWPLIHPMIKQVSMSRFQSQHYADAVRGAMVEIEDRLRSLVKLKTGKELSGEKLIRESLSPQKPIVILADTSNQVGNDIQRGYMEMLAGAMTGIRNPNSHKNLTIDKKEAIHTLFLTSLFMSKIDESEKHIISRFQGEDPYLTDIIKFAKNNGSILASLIQRKFDIGYARSARILDQLEKIGILGPFEAGKPRKVIIRE
jgi:uncharacterized protein (TIGR02391 family)